MSFAINYSPYIKLAIGVIGFVYILYILLKREKIIFSISKNINWIAFIKITLFKFFIISIATTILVWVTDASLLFNVVLNKPKLWLIILFIYTVFSVYPQELLYRTFFFKRYQFLFKSQSLFIFINAIVFSLAHMFFKSTLVLFMTFIGGLLFALTYKKTESTLLVSIEHALYGCWLFTVGMGDMLGFPT